MSGPDYAAVLEEICAQVLAEPATGEVADYIPPLAQVDPDQFAMCVQTLDGERFMVGDVATRFSVQSVTKVFTAAMVLSHKDIMLWERVGVEPSGSPFNSLIQLELEQGIPRNPFINAGAIVVADALCGLYDDPKAAILEFVHELGADVSVDYDHEVAHAERDTGFTNLALANYLRAHGNLEHEVDRVLDVYFHQCSIAMDAKCLAGSFGFLANDGTLPIPNGRQILRPEQCRRLNALMLTCGFYDQAGEFAYQVGLPGKSGVGGGIAAVVPGELSLAVWSPRLNEHGNSARGVSALEKFVAMTGHSIF